MSDLGIYVYGLVADGALAPTPDVQGVEGAHGVELVQHGEVCALISRVDLDDYNDETLRAHLSDLGWVERTARSHQRVLDHVVEQCTPIPMRMCTMYRDETGLRSMLEREYEGLRAGLRELESRLEWGVKAFALPGGTAARAGSPAAAQPAATGTAYLQSRLQQRSAGAQRQAALEQACEEVHSELSAMAAAARLNALQRPEVSGRDAVMLSNASYLVANERREDFSRRVFALGDEMSERGIELELTGPWPPYNFVPASIGGGL